MKYNVGDILVYRNRVLTVVEKLNFGVKLYDSKNQDSEYFTPDEIEDWHLYKYYPVVKV
jgi:NMD protein affecting ribosome stability and mRNA decay